MMATSKSFTLFFLVLCSWVFVGFCQGSGDNLPCVQKLMPCQPYLKSNSPPASCCVPLKQLVADDKACLCTVLNDPAILHNLNITKTDAVNLAKNCGSNADLSTCNNGDNPPCVQKLIPCQPYLKSGSPPASCCVPLKQLVTDDKTCLCKVLNDPTILQNLNITKTDAVNLAKNCGSNADLSTCNNGDDLPCVQKLVPCQPYLKSDSPPASCCMPLKQLVTDDKTCLCTVLNDPTILQSLNITKTDAANLAKNCGTNADLSTCTNAPPMPGSSPLTPSDGSTASSPTPKSAATVASFHVGTYLSLVVALSIFTKSFT
ncbi:uncharacterized protein [Henckelia pumila]|uniref:uncharacterized protein n=1 Tax=Henckelia pumila TaxID=405737 RepID=UPI003C6E7C79